MNPIRATSCLAVLLAGLLFSGPLPAQPWSDYAAPPSDFDWQLFAPMSSVGEDQIRPASEGYFGGYERMHFWMSRPNTVGVGRNVATQPPSNAPSVFIPNAVQYAYYTLDAPDGAADAEETLLFLLPRSDGGSFGFQFNSIVDATPKSATGWGNQLNLGYIQGDTGWMISIISGLDMHRQDRYGFDNKRLDQLGAAQGLDGLDGVIGDVSADVDPLDPVAPVPGIVGIPHTDGLTTVAVAFNDPFGLLLGFVDANADFLPDDLNGDGLVTAGAFPTGDQFRLGVVFDDMVVDSRTQVDGVELMAIRRKRALHGGAVAEMFVGARFLEVDDRFHVLARGGILADSEWSNDATNRIVGPQFGLRIAKRARRWSTVVSGRFMAGANFMSLRQTGVLGDHLATSGFFQGQPTPGIPLSFGGHEFMNTLRDERFSPTGDVKVETAIHVTKAVTLKAGWQGMVVGGIARGANTIDYALPALGIVNRSEDVFTHGVTFGVEVNR